jgi:cell wall-associated NlpC family hydrolase
MDDKERQERDSVDRIAREWIGTPFRDEAEVKGRNGGVDCAKLLKCVYTEAGLVADFKVPHYSPQFFLHSGKQEYLDWVLKYAHEIPQAQAQYGDLVLYWIGQCFAHGAIIIKPGLPDIVHAHFNSGCVRRGTYTAVHLGTPIKEMKFFSRW